MKAIPVVEFLFVCHPTGYGKSLCFALFTSGLRLLA